MAPSTFAMDYLNNVKISTERVPQAKPKTKEKKRSYRVIEGTKKESALSKSRFIGTAICILVLMTLLVFSVFLTARANNVKYNINKLTRETGRIENEITLVNTKIEAANSMNSISQYAFNELGLGAACADQYAIVNSSDIPEDLSEQIKSKVFG